MRTRTVNNSSLVRSMFEQKVRTTLYALGLAIVEVVITYMENNYGRRIYDTGNLIRSITFEVDADAKKVAIGTNVDYALYVHNGTARMNARPFLTDAIMENQSAWLQIVRQHLGEGWNIRV